MQRVLGRWSAVVIAAVFTAQPQLRAQALPRIAANDNTHAAGKRAKGVVSLDLVLVRGFFQPDGPRNPGEPLLAFAEAGKTPSIPAPLLRVRVGTTIEVAVRNTLHDATLIVYGLSEMPLADSLVVRPGETQKVRFTPKMRGTYFYYGSTTHKRVDRRFAEDSQLTGALIVDPANGPIHQDRVFVIGQWIDSANADGTPDLPREVLVLNGLSWPHTERFRHEVGETVNWRFINATIDPHPMHLHGFYYMVTARGDMALDTAYTRELQRRVVTERLLPGTTMSMTWAPEKPGNWIMHCHFTFHIVPHRPLGGSVKPTHPHDKHGHAIHGMSGLVLGIEVPVRGQLAKAAPARRALRLIVNETDSLPGEMQRRFGFVLHQPGTPEPARDSVPIPGTPIVVRQGEPISIQVVNRTTQPTSIHWHGIELESFFDGVAGFGGYPKQISPAVEPNDSFTVYMTPPRAGTFIYHTHVDERRQQPGGLNGAFIVLPPNVEWNPDTERVVLLSTTRNRRAPNNLLMNGKEQPEAFHLNAGATYRFRFINITMASANVSVHLKRGDQHMEWQPLAEDGADLEPHQTARRKAEQQISIGKTYDFAVTVKEPGELTLETRRANGTLMRTLPIIVR